MTARERATQIAVDYETATGGNPDILSSTLIRLIEKAIIETMKDQRHACAEAVQTADFGVFNVSTIVQKCRAKLRQAVMNAAEIREEGEADR